jgi:hypothetical protein
MTDPPGIDTATPGGRDHFEPQFGLEAMYLPLLRRGSACSDAGPRRRHG